MDSLESRRLLAFVPSGASTVTGTEFQSVDKIVTLPGGGYVAAGEFSDDTTFTSGNDRTSLGETDVFIQYVNGSQHQTLTLGTDNGKKLKFYDDRVDFISLPRRVDDETTPFGVSSIARRGDEYVSQMKLGPDGKLYVAMIFKRELLLDTTNPKSKTLQPDDQFEGKFYDSAILRYSISGGKLTLERTTQIGGPFNDVIEDFAFDTTGNLLVTGTFERQCDFDPTSGRAVYDPEGRSDAFVAKYGRSGKLQWVSSFGSDVDTRTEIEASFGVVAGASDSLYIGGVFAGDARFNHNGSHSRKTIAEADDDTDGFTMRLDSNGKLSWVRTQGGGSFDGIRAITAAPDGGVYNVGYFEDDADLDPTSHEQIFDANDNGDHNRDTPTDLFFTRFDSAGNVVTLKSLSGEGYELVASATTNAAGDLVIAGSFSGPFDVDPSRRVRLLTTPDSDNKDRNENDRKHAYAGFVAVYSGGLKLSSVQQITGLEGQDVFINGASMSSTGQLAIAGRYRGGFTVAGTTVRTNTDFDDYREDGFALVFNAGLNAIV